MFDPGQLTGHDDHITAPLNRKAHDMTTAVRRGNVPRKKSVAERTAERRAKATEIAAEVAAKQAEVRKLNAAITKGRADLLGIVEALKVDELDLEGPNGEQLRVVRVQASSDQIDENKLRKLIGKAWSKVTRQVLDGTLLEAAVANGDIDPRHVAQCTTTVDGSPYVKVSTKGTPASSKAE